MKIFVANLRKNADRRESISSQLSALGLDYELITGVDGRALSSSELKAFCGGASSVKSCGGRAMTAAEIGCALTHTLMYKKFLESGESHAVFLEDDALILDGFRDFIRDFDYSFDFLILGYGARTKFEINYTNWIDPVYNKAVISSRFTAGISPRKKSFGMVGVVLSRKMAKKIVDLQTPISFVADDHKAFSRYCTIFHLRPVVVAEEMSLPSTIIRRRRDNALGLSFRVMASRMLKGLFGRLRILFIFLRG